ncbi:helix-turn-helix transcriptional regulator [Aquabacterium sp. OR-4]|uniref:helix-turn-helix transcriptional regulator n=1 Tax=Aquabacterium sp. OR-4 TaxID=2978127 RepID=UPI0021B366A0|nr:helix-turn-helix transcriptional regulator [Aquabacterium sp. OR-4]MDT7833661.1 helix-turn-helix transcriptional regulator [Aquabacterium sp. OR-4]
MLDLHDTRSAHVAEFYAGFAATLPATRSRGYAGPERRGAASQQHRRMAQMLDTLDHGLLLVDAEGRIAHLNKAARRDLDSQHPLQLAGDHLGTRQSADSVPLREALQGAAHRGLRRLLMLGEGRQRVSVAVVPLAPLGTESQHGVALLLGRRQVCEELTVDWYARAHNLTMAETAVIKGLCADFTPQEIAQRQGVGLATIRTQIGSIRQKTGAGSIRALVRQVSLLPPLVSALQAPAAAAAAPAGAEPARAAATGPTVRANGRALHA